MTRQTRDIDGGSGGVFYQRVGERFSSNYIMERFLRNGFGHGLRLCPIPPKDNDTGVAHIGFQGLM